MQLREWKERTIKGIFYIDPKDSEVLRMKREKKQVTAAATTKIEREQQIKDSSR